MLMESGDEMGRVLEKFWRELTGFSFVTISTRRSRGEGVASRDIVLANQSGCYMQSSDITFVD